MKNTIKTEKTLCKGAVDFAVQMDGFGRRTITAQFSKIAPHTNLCTACEWHSLCSKIADSSLPDTETSKELTPDTPTVTVKAFTGMPIGSFPIYKRTRKYIEVRTKKNATLRFDITTGQQVNSPNPRFANHIDITPTPDQGGKN